jgi:hypothetical protein
MRAILRCTAVFLAGALLSGAALAQETSAPPASNTPATDAVGPRELQNFSLPGTTTRPADQPPATSVPSDHPPRVEPPAEGSARAPAPAARAPAPRAAPTESAAATSTASPPTQAPISLPPPPVQAAPAPVVQAPLTASAEPPPVAPAGTLAPSGKLSILPWIAAALALAAGTIFLLWRRRPREALGGPQFDLLVAPEPAPAPPPRPQPAPRSVQPQPAPPPKPAAPATNGIVAARLRPSLEIGVQPLRCIVGDDQVVIEFEIDLFNAGTAPARAVHAEASLFNPGPNQEQELTAFFANPAGVGDRLEGIPPMKRITLTSQVVAPRSAIHEYELAGRKSFVPVIAFNAQYEWGSGKGQTSAAYLVGRETSGDKLGPLRLEPAPREIRGLGVRSLPVAVST